MDESQFSGSAGTFTHAFTPQWGPYEEFNPKLLPVKIELDDELINLLISASNELGYINGMGMRGAATQLLINTYLKKEAISSSRIEGTKSSFDDVLLAEAQEEKSRKPFLDDMEALKNVRTLKLGLDLIKTQDINLSLLLELHKTLLSGFKKYDLKKPGSLRTEPNYVIHTDDEVLEGKIDIKKASYIPPNATSIPVYLENFFNYLNDSSNTTSELLKIGIAHYQFEAIHPFFDGNGRIGRILILLLLVKKSLLQVPVLDLSYYFEKNKRKYFERLLKVSEDGDYIGWLKFFLEGIITELRDIKVKETQLLEYYNLKHSQMTAIGNISALKILEELNNFDSLYITIPQAQALLNKSYPTTKSAIYSLVNIGVLTEITGQQTHKLYFARDIFNIMKQ